MKWYTKICVASVAALITSSALANLVVIGNPAVQITHISQIQLSHLYFKDHAELALTPVDQDSSSKSFQLFYPSVLHHSTQYVKGYWAERLYAGIASRPIQVSNDQAAIDYVAHHKTAIAYVTAQSLEKSKFPVKVLWGSAAQIDQHHADVAARHQLSNAQLRKKLLAEIAALNQEKQKYDQLSQAQLQAQAEVVPQKNKLLGSLADLVGDGSQNVWSSMADNFELSSDYDNPAVQKELNYYVAHKAIVNDILQRSKPYIAYVYAETQAHHVPAEFALLPMVESGFNPHNVSSVGAKGLWQLMPSMADGNPFLNVTWWYDGRLDLHDSTNVALSFIKNLHDRLGSWALAAAAYDAGEGTVLDAVRYSIHMGHPADYWHLTLPAETKAYYPKLLAFAEIIQNPEKYGFTLPNITVTPAVTEIKLNNQIDRAEAAALAGISLTTLENLNPDMRRWATPGNQFHLFIPTSHLKLFKENIKKMKQNSLIDWQKHTFTETMRVSTLAKRYHTSETLLKEANDLHHDDVYAGDPVLVPVYEGKHFSQLDVKQMSIAQLKKVLVQAKQEKNIAKSKAIKSGVDTEHLNLMGGDTQVTTSQAQSTELLPPTISDTAASAITADDILNPKKS